MPNRTTAINPGKAGPKGALGIAPQNKGKGEPSSGTRGNEGNNTRRDFVRLAKGKKKRSPRSS